MEEPRPSDVLGAQGEQLTSETIMCRFALLTAPTPCDMRPYVLQFVRMCQQSTGLHGEGWQGDGWGVAWRDDHEAWQVQHSVAPLWTEIDAVQHLPPTRPCSCMLGARRL